MGGGKMITELVQVFRNLPILTAQIQMAFDFKKYQKRIWWYTAILEYETYRQL